MRHKSFQLFILLVITSIFSCSDPASIGADLLIEDQANLQFTNETPIQATTIEGDVLQTYSPFVALQLGRHLFGRFEDPVVGISEASIYSQISLGTQSPPDTIIQSFDSVILSLAYDTLFSYGDINESFSLEVLQVEEDLSNIADYFSNQTFQTASTPIGSADFIPDLITQPTIVDYSLNPSGDNVTTYPHLRIPLSGDFITMLAQDTSLFSSDTTFQNFFKGIHIKPTSLNSSMFRFDFTNAISRISFYYTTSDSTNAEYKLDFTSGNARVLNISHDYESTLVNDALQNLSDSLLFIQGMTGVNTQITFPDLSSLDGIVVNKAELEFTVADLPQNDTTAYPLATQLIASLVDGSGESDILPDVQAAFSSAVPIVTEIHGGIPVVETQDGTSVTKYKINISSYFQSVLNGETENSFKLSNGVEQNSWYFQLPPKAIDPSKVILYGPNHPQYPMKLNLTYTIL